MSPSRRDAFFHLKLAAFGAVFVLTTLLPTVMYRLGRAAAWTRWFLSEDARKH